LNLPTSFVSFSDNADNSVADTSIAAETETMLYPDAFAASVDVASALVTIWVEISSNWREAASKVDEEATTILKHLF